MVFDHHRFTVHRTTSSVVQTHHKRRIRHKIAICGTFDTASGGNHKLWRHRTGNGKILFQFVGHMQRGLKFRMVKIVRYIVWIVQGQIQKERITFNAVLINRNFNPVSSLEGFYLTERELRARQKEVNGIPNRTFGINGTNQADRLALPLAVKLPQVELRAPHIERTQLHRLLTRIVAVKRRILKRTHENSLLPAAVFVYGFHLLPTTQDSNFIHSQNRQYHPNNQQYASHRHHPVSQPFLPCRLTKVLIDQQQHRHGSGHCPVRLRVTFQRHNPKEQDEARDGINTSPHENISRSSMTPAKKQRQAKTNGVEHQQLIRQIFQGMQDIESCVTWY